MKRYQNVFAVLFMLVVFAMMFWSVFENSHRIVHDVGDMEKPAEIADVQRIPSEIDAILGEHLVKRNSWVELYGSVYKLLGKHEENAFTYVKDKNGYFYSGNFWNTSMVDEQNLALRIRSLQDEVSGKGTKVICIMCPTKYNEKWTEGYCGIPYNNMNKFADKVLLQLRRYNVDYIDFREVFLAEKMSLEDIFYRTDHRWNNPAAFGATGVIVDHLKRKYGDDWDPNGYYMSPDNYAFNTYEEIFLGYQGNEVGTGYIDRLDDYTYIYPKFDTEYTYTYISHSGDEREDRGSVRETIITDEHLEEKDVYERELGSSYLRGGGKSDQIVNENIQDGRKILFLRDSFASQIAVFMAPMCKEIDLYQTDDWEREEIEDVIRQEQYDYIFVTLSVDNFTDEGIPFYADAVSKKIAGFRESE